MLYAVVLYAYWDLLDDGQRILGLVVGGRETLYWLMTIVSLYRNPCYLLVDLRASWNQKQNVQFERWIEVGMYVLAPEKYVGWAIVREERLNTNLCIGMIYTVVFLPMLDMAGVVALIWAVVSRNIYPPLMIGYAVTTIGGLSVIIGVVLFCCGCGHNESDRTDCQ